MQEAGAALYQQQPGTPDGAPGEAAGGEPGQQPGEAPDEDVIEGEFSDA